MNRSRSMHWMSLTLLLLGSILLVPDLIFSRRTLSQSVSVPSSAPPAPSSSASLIDPAASGGSETDASADDVGQRVDVRGNEIARPVARYRVDERGSMYEVHSPQTEIARLKPPQM
jgi:hypothetical protein